MTKILIYIFGGVVVLVGGFFVLNTYFYNKKQVNVASDYKNITYSIGGYQAALINGKSEIETAPGSVSRVITQYFGNEVLLDINSDGKQDIAFLVTQTTGGSGVFYYVVVALNTDKGYVGSQGFLLGDRIAPQTTEITKGNTIIVNYTDRKSGESFVVKPSVGKSLQLILDPVTMQFKEVIEDTILSVTYFKSSADSIVVESPLPGSVVEKEFEVTGKARGSWFFEASFPIKLLDKNGAVLAVFIAEAKSNWMTENFVPFKTDIKIPESYNGPVTLVLQKDNPSGLLEYNASISFSLVQSATTAINTGTENGVPIKLYYYNPKYDQGPGGLQCSKQGLVAVSRSIPRTITPIQDTVKLLLQGDISEIEKAKGITSEFPLVGLSLKSASLNSGMLTLTFNDSQNKTGGGSCRISILGNQIEATAKQFPGVVSVRFLPEELFQP